MFTCQGCQRYLFPFQAAYADVCQDCLFVLVQRTLGSRPVYVDYATALSAVQNDAASNDWRRYQVSYPESARGKWRISKVDSGFVQFASRIAFIMLEGAERDMGPGPFTVLAENTRAGFAGWMTDSRVEVIEHYPLFTRLTEAKPGTTVLINGLGLGVAARAALLEPNIARVDVVDLDADVIGLVEPLIRDERLHVHLADAHTIEWPEGQTWDLAWHDIWIDISRDNLPSLNRLMGKYTGRAAWQGSWAHDELSGLAMRL